MPPKSSSFVVVLRSVILLSVVLALTVGCNSKGNAVAPNVAGDKLSGQILASGTQTSSQGSPGTDTSQLKKYADDEVLVVFNSGIAVSQANTVFQANALSVKKTIVCKWGTVYELGITDCTPVPDMVSRLKSLGNVRFCEPNYIYYFQEAPYRPNDSDWENQYDVGDDPRDNIYDQWGPAKVGAPIVWNETKGSSDVVIAIIDTGIRRTHVDLAENIWNNADEIPDNGIDDDNNGYIDDTWGWDTFDNDNDPHDEDTAYYHGTACAGVIAAVIDNNTGLAGIAPGVKLMALRVGFGSAFEGYMVEAVEYAANNGADILNMSFGGNANGEIFHAALDAAWDNGNGTNNIASAGNDDSSEIYYPASYSSVQAVSGTIPFTGVGDPMDEKKIANKQDGYQWGSNYGPWISVSGFAEQYMTTDGMCDNCYHDRLGGNLFGGTSCAAPVAVGVMALIRSTHPGQNAQWYRERLENTADDLYTTGYDTYTGYGRCNAVRAVYGSDRFESIADSNGYVPFNPDDGSMFDTIHDFPGSPFHDPVDLYKFTVDDTTCFEINLDIYTWGENLDLALYSDPGMGHMLSSATVKNHADSSFEKLSYENIVPGTEYYLKVYSPVAGNSSTYGISLSKFTNSFSVDDESIAPDAAYQTAKPIPLLKLNCHTDYQATLKQLIIRKNGSAPNESLIEGVIALDENKNGTWDDSDPIVGRADFGGLNQSRFPDLSLICKAPDVLTLLIGVTSSGAPDCSTLGISLESYKDISTHEGLLPPYTNFPIASGLTELSFDGDPPYWLTTVGAQNAIPDYGFAVIEFNAAQDDITPPVIYNAYYTDTLPFGSGDVTQVKNVEVLSGSTTDLKTTLALEAGKEWYVEIRAEDRAGNEDTNDVIVSCTPLVGGDPLNPQIIQTVAGPKGWAIAMKDDIIITVAGYSTFNVYKKNRPTDVEFVSSLDLGQKLYDVACDGHFAYTIGWDGFNVIDLSDYANPEVVATNQVHGENIVLNGKYAYVVHGDSSYNARLYTIDISNPHNIPPPKLLTLQVGWIGNLTINGNYLYLCKDNYGILVFDISDPSNPLYLNCFGDVEMPINLLVDDNKLYLTGYGNTLYLYDLAVSPNNPPLLDSYPGNGVDYPLGLVVIDHSYLYAAVTGTNALDVFDIRNPMDIQHLIRSDLYPTEMVNDGKIIYGTAGKALLVII